MKTFEKLTVGEYQELYRIHSKNEDNSDIAIIDRACDTLSILTGKPRWEVEESMTMQNVFEISKRMVVLFSNPPIMEKPRQYLRINGKLYKVCLNPRQLTAAQFTDIQAFMKRGTIENLHKIIASIINPCKGFRRKVGKYDAENHEEVSRGIQNLSLMPILSISGFFLLLWNHSIKALVPFLNEEIKSKMKNPESLQMDLTTIMDGFITSMPSGNLTGLR